MVARKLRVGMIGGGQGSFIGQVHRIAAAMDGLCELVCGVFSRDRANNAASGFALGLSERRVYRDYHQMMVAEAAFPETERMDFVVIATPNESHWPIAESALQHGFHVLSDKPATVSLDQCLALQSLLKKTGLLYGISHVYTGYPLVKEARRLVQDGRLGRIRKIVVEYSQDWLADQQCERSKQAQWRLDPQQSGISCCMGDIGVHAANLAEYISGLSITQVCADLDHVVSGRTLDDDGNVLLKFNNQAKGVLIASQVSVGEENNLNIRVYGDKASLQWCQQQPNTLVLKPWQAPQKILSAANAYLGECAKAGSRIPSGHPEGYLEAFANIYRNFAAHLTAYLQQDDLGQHEWDYPNIDDALRGMQFIEAVVASGQSAQKWYTIPAVSRSI